VIKFQNINPNESNEPVVLVSVNKTYKSVIDIDMPVGKECTIGTNSIPTIGSIPHVSLTNVTATWDVPVLVCIILYISPCDTMTTSRFVIASSCQ